MITFCKNSQGIVAVDLFPEPSSYYHRRQPPVNMSSAEADRMYKETEKWLQEASGSGADEIRIPEQLPRYVLY